MNCLSSIYSQKYTYILDIMKKEKQKSEKIKKKKVCIIKELVGQDDQQPSRSY